MLGYVLRVFESLPTDEEREAILNAIHGLIEACGHQCFVAGHVLLPDDRYFPDRWRPDALGCRRIALRLMRYAGLEKLDASMEVFHGVARVDDSHHVGAAAVFYGIEEDMALFGIDASQLNDSQAVVGALCHEVAHAYRAYHGLEVEDRDREEMLTDITTIYLGFGVMTTNITSRHRSAALDGSSLVGHEWSHSSLGYLSPQAMAYSLALQTVVRSYGDTSTGETEKFLEPNQRKMYRAAKRAHSNADLLLERLDLPAPSTWPPLPDLVHLTEAIDDADLEAEFEAEFGAGTGDTVEDAPDSRGEYDRLEARRAMRLGRLRALVPGFGFGSLFAGAIGLGLCRGGGDLSGAMEGHAERVAPVHRSNCTRLFRCSHCRP